MTKNHAALLTLSARIARADLAAGLGFCELTFRESLRTEADFEGLRLPSNPGRWTECVEAYRATLESSPVRFEELRSGIISHAERAGFAAFDSDRPMRDLANAAWKRALLCNALGRLLARATDADRASAQRLHGAAFRASLV